MKVDSLKNETVIRNESVNRNETIKQFTNAHHKRYELIF